MHSVISLAGVLCVIAVLFDAFQTIILPRRAIGRIRITTIFYVFSWRPWSWIARRVRNPKKRETLLSYYGPLSLILLLGVWAGTLLVGFALMYYGLGSPFNDPEQKGFPTDLYVSGTTVFTLGLGDVVPHDPIARALVILESGTGLGLLAVVMGYFPVLYGAFSRREVSISLLDARAGSPPTAAELIRRHAFQGGEQSLSVLLLEWERWSAELLESHISYPLLCYFRSQHNNQSWLSALTAILDASALLIAGVRGHEARQAQLTFAMARHALVDLAQIFHLAPVTDAADRLPTEVYERLYDALCATRVGVCRDENSADRLREMRALYEGHCEALSRFLQMALPPWISDGPHKDNWQKVAMLRARTENEGELNAGTPPDPGQAASLSAIIDSHHDF
jgi:hypothetical protein